MGLDLTAAPIKYGAVNNYNWWLAYDRLSFERNYDLFGQIDDCGRVSTPPILKPQLLPLNVKFDWYEDGGIKTRNVDPYGEVLKYVLASDFKRIVMPEHSGEWNRAVIAFLCSLPEKTPVVLWWH